MTKKFKENPLKILQWNIRSASLRKEDLEILIKKHSPDIITLQETQLKNAHAFKLKGYQDPVRLDLENIGKSHGGGLLTTAKNNLLLEFENSVVNESCHALNVLIYTQSQTPVRITNLYREGRGPESLEKGALPIFKAVEKVDENPHIVLGDFNSFHDSWCPNPTNSQKPGLGKHIHKYVLENMQLHNTGSNTFIHSSLHTETAPDLTLSYTSDKLINLTWSTEDDLCGSDHFPIISTWSTGYNSGYEPPIGRLKFKIEKANWPLFRDAANRTVWIDFRHDDNEKHLANIQDQIVKIAKTAIPFSDPSKSGKLPKKAIQTNPWWTPECAEIKELRRLALQKYRITKSQADKETYRILNNKATHTMKRAKRHSWRHHTNSLNQHTQTNRLWQTIQSLEGTNSYQNNIHPLTTADMSKETSHKGIANTLGKHYSKISSEANTLPQFQTKKEEITKNNPTLKMKQLNDDNYFNKPIELHEIESVLKSKSQTAPGQDILQYGIYRNLPHSAKIEILHLFNKIWKSGEIPKTFKHATVIPIKKPNKPNDQASSYRPISLTSHLGKTLEAVITKRLTNHILRNNLISNKQSGFLPNRQTLDQLIRLVHEVELCKTKNKATAAVFIDLEKAFDTMSRDVCLAQLQKKGITGNMYNYILNYLQNRTFQVKVGNTLSEVNNQELGVPQGGILSPILFNITLDSVESLEETHPKVDEGKYADDNSGWVKASFAPSRKSKNRVKKLENIMVPATESLIANLEKHGFKVNVDKTQIILFNTRSEAVWTINGQKISTQPSVKYLGVTFDKFLTFGKHIKNRCEIGQKAINILKRLGNGKFGLNSRHRQRVFKGYILPKITYGEEIYHNAAKSHLNNIDKLQNQGMRLIAGVPLSTSSMALCVLTKIPPAYLRREERLLHLWKRIAYNPKNPANSVYETELSLTAEYKKTPLVVITKRLSTSRNIWPFASFPTVIAGTTQQDVQTP